MVQKKRALDIERLEENVWSMEKINALLENESEWTSIDQTC